MPIPSKTIMQHIAFVALALNIHVIYVSLFFVSSFRFKAVGRVLTWYDFPVSGLRLWGGFLHGMIFQFQV